MSDTYAANLELGSSVITWLFIFEMGLKLLSLGCTRYWSDGWNVLDGSIVIMSIGEIVTTIVFAGEGANVSFLRIFRMLRLVRMLRLMRSWKGLYKIVTTMLNAIPHMSNIVRARAATHADASRLSLQRGPARRGVRDGRWS